MQPSETHVQKLKHTLQFQFPGLSTGEILRGISIALSRKTGRIRGVSDQETGKLLFSLRTSDGRYMPTFAGARRMDETGYEVYRIVMMEDAVPFVAKGKSAFCKHVKSADEMISPRSEVLLYSPDGELIAVGIAQQPAYAMLELSSGLAVKVKHSRD